MFLNQYNKQKTAIVDRSGEVSYSLLGQKINLYTELIKDVELEKIAIYSENRLGWVYSFYAGWNCGAIVVPVDFMSTVEEVAFILNDSKPEVVFASKEKAKDLEQSLQYLTYQPKVYIIDDYENASVAEDTSYPVIDPDRSKVAVIIYTSGTTGSPKGVMLTYDNILSNIYAVYRDVKIFRAEDRILMLLPLHHIFPLLGTMVMPLFAGALIALSPSMSSEDIINTLQKNKITLLIGVPRLYAAIRKGIVDKIHKSKMASLLFSVAGKVQSKSLSRFIFKAVHKKFGGAVRYIVSGGAALDAEIGGDFKTLGFEVLEGYGMTEAAPMISFTRPGKVKVGSPGFTLPNCEVDIRDGEIVVRGANIMKGYYNRPEETAEILKDGWLYTGDLGHFDNDGFLFITGRKKEIIILSNGKNINPAEIEQKLENYAAFVKEVGVYQRGDQLRAIIVPSDEIKYRLTSISELTQKMKWEVIDPYNQGCTSYKKVMDFTVYDGELPRTRLGKIRRFKLAELEAEAPEMNFEVEHIDLQEYEILADYLEQEKGKKIFPHFHLEMDLGLDSLDKVSLQVFIQSSFGIDIDPGQLVKFADVKELAEYVHEHRSKMAVEKIDWTKILKEKVNLSLPRTWVVGRMFVRMSKLFFKGYLGLRAKGLNNIPDEPCIIAPNHQSYFDGLFVASFLKNKTIKNTYFYAKEKHVSSRWLKYIANRNNVIVMDLNKDLKESIQKMGEALKKKKNLIIFPEGTRTKNGKLGDFKKTFAILSRELNVPIVPVSIKGAYDALPKGTYFPKPFKNVLVEFLEPVTPGAETYDNISKMVYNRISFNQASIQ